MTFNYKVEVFCREYILFKAFLRFVKERNKFTYAGNSSVYCAQPYLKSHFLWFTLHFKFPNGPRSNFSDIMRKQIYLFTNNKKFKTFLSFNISSFIKAVITESM